MTRGQLALHGPSQTFRAGGCAPLREAAEAGALDVWAYGRGSYPGTRLPEGVLPQLQSVGYAASGPGRCAGLERRDCDGIEFTCVTGGHLQFSCDKQEYGLGARSITIRRPWQRHRIGKPATERAEVCWFVVDVHARRPNQDWQWPHWLPIPAPDLQRLTELLRHDETPVRQAGPALTAAIDRLERTLREPVSLPVARMALGIAEVLVEISDQLEQEDIELDPYLSSTERMVQMFLSSLADRLGEPWTLNRMAETCGLGRTRFVHYCKEAVAVSPQEYLAELRLRRAAELLHTTDLPISQIAVQCGFQTSQYFATVFRRRFGRTPGASRNEEVSAHAS